MKVRFDFLAIALLTLETLLAVSAILLLSSFLGQQIWPAHKIDLLYYGCFASVIIIGGVIFQRISLWEIHKGKIRNSFKGLVCDEPLVTTKMLIISWSICALLLLISLASFYFGLKEWLHFSKTMQAICGQPTLFSMFALIFFTIGGDFLRYKHAARHAYYQKMSYSKVNHALAN